MFFKQNQKKKPKKSKEADDQFFKGGLIWFGRMVASGLLVFIEFIVITNLVIWLYSNGKFIKSSDEILNPKVVLLLGTNKLTASGKDNIYYYARIDAVDDLYRANKVKLIIISGDNRDKRYNEPRDMMRDLMKMGIPKKMIKLDYAGFRTLDSVVRLKTENDVNDVIIVTQDFHARRALFLALFYGIKAKAYAAKGNMTYGMIKRELLAKPKVLMDIFVFNMQPKFTQFEAKKVLKPSTGIHYLMGGMVLVLVILSVYFLKKTFVY